MRCLFLVFLIAVTCRGEDVCPWLNNATAAGVLGGQVTLRKIADVCIFTSTFSQLGIDVHTASLPYKLVCGPNSTPLKAIGNEAIACSPEEKNGKISEQVAGRVRDRAFVVRITSTDRSIPRSAFREKVRSVAEQVAGALF